MSPIEALQKDYNKALIELAQVEHQYIEIVSPGPANCSKSTVDVSSEHDPPYYDGLYSHSETGNYGLIIAARNDISSMWFSLSSKSRTDGEALWIRITWHRRRLSKMLEDNKGAISQRWTHTSQDNGDKAPDSSSPVLFGFACSQDLIRG